MKSEPGPPATLGSTAAAHLRLIVWCKDWPGHRLYHADHGKAQPYHPNADINQTQYDSRLTPKNDEKSAPPPTDGDLLAIADRIKKRIGSKRRIRRLTFSIWTWFATIYRAMGS